MNLIPSIRLTIATAAIGLFGATLASALTITPSTPAVLKGNETSENAIVGIINANFPSVSLLYKATRADGSEAGPYMGSYATDFSNPAPLVPSSALITYTGGAAIGSDPVYAFIRDGSYNNYNWYLFDISGWNGTEPVGFSGFFPLAGGGSQNISHIGIYGTPGNNVPDGGSTALLLGTAFLSLVAMGRRFIA